MAKATEFNAGDIDTREVVSTAIREKLSDRARERAKKLEAVDDDVEGKRLAKHASLTKLNEELADARRQHAHTEHAVAVAGRPYARSQQGENGIVENAPYDELAPIAARIDDLNRKIAEKNAIFVPFSPWPGVKKYIARNRRKMFHDVELPALSSRKDLRAALRDVHTAQAALRERRDEVENAPAPTSDAKKLVAAQIASFRERGTPVVAGLLKAGNYNGKGEWTPQFRGRIGFAKERLPLHDNGNVVMIPDSIALLAWLFPDQLEKKIAELVDERGHDANAISVADKPAMLAAIDAEHFESERLEVEILFAMLDAGQPVTLRHGISPEAMLGVAVVDAPPGGANETLQEADFG